MLDRDDRPHDFGVDSAQRVMHAHSAAKREQENPPHLLARVTHGPSWAEVWLAGLDAVYWFYRVSSFDEEVTLVARHSGGPEDRFQIDDPLLSEHEGIRLWPDVDGWERYLDRWLKARTG
jgi:hypothetical protein